MANLAAMSAWLEANKKATYDQAKEFAMYQLFVCEDTAEQYLTYCKVPKQRGPLMIHGHLSGVKSYDKVAA